MEFLVRVLALALRPWLPGGRRQLGRTWRRFAGRCTVRSKRCKCWNITRAPLDWRRGDLRRSRRGWWRGRRRSNGSLLQRSISRGCRWRLRLGWRRVSILSRQCRVDRNRESRIYHRHLRRCQCSKVRVDGQTVRQSIRWEQFSATATAGASSRYGVVIDMGSSRCAIGRG